MCGSVVMCEGVAITNQTNEQTTYKTRRIAKKERHTQRESERATVQSERQQSAKHTHRKRMKRRKKKNDNYIKHNYKARASNINNK